MTKKQVKKDEKVISEPETEGTKEEIEEVEEVPVSEKKKEVTEAQRAHLANIRVKALKVKAEKKLLREKAKELEKAELELKAQKYDKTIEERLAASIAMIELSFNTKDFVKQKVDRQIFSSYKKIHN